MKKLDSHHHGKVGSLLKNWNTFLVVILVLEFVIFGAANPKFLRIPLLLSSVNDFIAICLISLFVTFVMITGGIDIQVLGIGRNGHIGFNEPADTFVYGCHIVNLTQSTIQANRRFFESEDDVPRQAISLGIGSIMNARRILLLATGADKAEAIRNAVYGDINPRTQASILRTHSNVIFLLDKAAAGLL